MNIEEAKEIMRTIDGNIKSQNYEYDYLRVVKAISIEDLEYWFYLSQVLRKLPDSCEMDLRDNGVLAAAIFASEKSYNFSPNSAGTIAERILSLTMFVHGLSANLNMGVNLKFESGKCFKDMYESALESLRSIVVEGVTKFPDDEWFQEQKSDVTEDFGLN